MSYLSPRLHNSLFSFTSSQNFFHTCLLSKSFSQNFYAIKQLFSSRFLRDYCASSSTELAPIPIHKETESEDSVLKKENDLEIHNETPKKNNYVNVTFSDPLPEQLGSVSFLPRHKFNFPVQTQKALRTVVLWSSNKICLKCEKRITVHEVEPFEESCPILWRHKTGMGTRRSLCGLEPFSSIVCLASLRRPKKEEFVERFTPSCTICIAHFKNQKYSIAGLLTDTKLKLTFTCMPVMSTIAFLSVIRGWQFTGTTEIVRRSVAYSTKFHALRYRPFTSLLYSGPTGTRTGGGATRVQSGTSNSNPFGASNSTFSVASNTNSSGSSNNVVSSVPNSGSIEPPIRFPGRPAVLSSPSPPSSVKHTSTPLRSNATNRAVSMADAHSEPICEIHFNNPETALRYFSSAELVKRVGLFSALRFPFLSQNAQLFLNIGNAILGKRLTHAIIRLTLFKHFCGGEDIAGLRRTACKLSHMNLGSIVDYAAESEEGVPCCNENVELTKTAIATAATFCIRNPNTNQIFNPPFTAFKMTSICDCSLMQNVTLLINLSHALYAVACDVECSKTWQSIIKRHLHISEGHDKLAKHSLSREKFNSVIRLIWPDIEPSEINQLFLEISKSPGGVDKDSITYFQFTSVMSPEKLSSLPTPAISDFPTEYCLLERARLSSSEVEEWNQTKRRFDDICLYSSQHKVRLLVDAEQTFFQPAIDYLARLFMQNYNSLDKGGATIYNTYQMYLKNALGRVKCDILHAEMFSYTFAGKLVRGAYMNQEEKLAASRNIPSPIHPHIQATHTAYDTALNLLIASNINTRTELLCGTHNEASVKHAIHLLRSKRDSAKSNSEFQKTTAIVAFAQLLGMCDHVSSTLAQSGYPTYKYVPYGPLNVVIPYLIRRAEENSSLLSSSGAEIRLMLIELRRRLKDKLLGW